MKLKYPAQRDSGFSAWIFWNFPNVLCVISAHYHFKRIK